MAENNNKLQEFVKELLVNAGSSKAETFRFRKDKQIKKRSFMEGISPDTLNIIKKFSIDKEMCQIIIDLAYDFSLQDKIQSIFTTFKNNKKKSVQELKKSKAKRLLRIEEKRMDSILKKAHDIEKIRNGEQKTEEKVEEVKETKPKKERINVESKSEGEVFDKDGRMYIVIQKKAHSLSPYVYRAKRVLDFYATMRETTKEKFNWDALLQNENVQSVMKQNVDIILKSNIKSVAPQDRSKTSFFAALNPEDLYRYWGKFMLPLMLTVSSWAKNKNTVIARYAGGELNSTNCMDLAVMMPYFKFAKGKLSKEKNAVMQKVDAIIIAIGNELLKKNITGSLDPGQMTILATEIGTKMKELKSKVKFITVQNTRTDQMAVERPIVEKQKESKKEEEQKPKPKEELPSDDANSQDV